MKWIVGVILVGLIGQVPARAQPIGPNTQVYCNQIAVLAVGSTGLTQIIAAVAGQRIFICGWHITNTGGAGTFVLTEGTGSNCGTGGITRIPATNVTSSAPSADHTASASWQTGASAAFCVNPSVNTIATVVFFAQF